MNQQNKYIKAEGKAGYKWRNSGGSTILNQQFSNDKSHIRSQLITNAMQNLFNKVVGENSETRVMGVPC